MVPELPMVGSRVPIAWQRQTQEIALVIEQKQVEVIRKALAQHLVITDHISIKGVSAVIQARVASAFRKLTGLGRLVGR